MYHDIAFVFTGSLTGPVYYMMLASSQNQHCVLPMLAPSQDQSWLFAEWLTKFGLFHKSQQYSFGSCDSISRLHQVHFSP
jgi:hypothetical protein